MKFLITIVLTLLLAFSVFAQSQAEVIVTSTYLRKLPETSAEKVQTVQKGDKVTFEKSQVKNGWYYVSILNGTVKGWIRKDTVGSIVKARTDIQKPPKKNVSTPTPIATETPIIIIVPSPKLPKNPKVTPKVTPKATSKVTPKVIPSPTSIEDDEVLRVETEEISLNVRVVNEGNRSVNNLKQSDFKIYEDNVLQPITFFTTAEIPIINALVIDNSRSLRSQLIKVLEAGKIIIAANRPKDETTIVRFVSKDKIEVVQDFTSNKSSLYNALDNLYVEGGQTAIIDAVYQTAKKVEQYQSSTKKEDVKLRSLILVSDGDDRGSSYNEDQLFKLLRELNIQIYTIGFVNDLSKEAELNGMSRQDKARKFLIRLAQETGGKVYFPNSINELPQIAADISGELRTQYLISYNPTNTGRGGTFRQIKVVVTEGANKEKRIAITRSGRNAPTN